MVFGLSIDQTDIFVRTFTFIVKLQQNLQLNIAITFYDFILLIVPNTQKGKHFHFDTENIKAITLTIEEPTQNLINKMEGKKIC